MSDAVRSAQGSADAGDGVLLRWTGREPAGQARARLTIVHGLSDHADRYVPFAGDLAAHGIAAYAFDLRGHGHSPGPRGHAPSFDTLLADLSAVHAELAARTPPGTPAFVFGHSMGGLLALRWAQATERAARGVVLSAPWLATTTPVPAWKRLPAVVLEHIVPALPVPAGIDPDAISDLPEAVRAYREDPAVHGRISPRLYREAGRASAAARTAAPLRVPSALILLPAGDRIVDPVTTRALVTRLPGDDITLREWPVAAHELLHSTKRAAVTAVVRDWILARVTP